MDSQGRSRLIVVGLTLAAIVLVISLLLTQQSTHPSAMVESPLTNDATAPVVPDDKATGNETPSAQVESPLANPDSSGQLRLAPANTPIENAPTTAEIITTEVASVASAGQVSELLASTVTVTLAAPRPLRYGFEVVASYPHDPGAFTQGLQYVDGVLYEGTGLYGHSSLRRVNLESGEVEQQINLAPAYFGEGIHVLEDRIYQLTWQSQVAFLYDRESFALLGEFSYPTEGWGLTYDGETLLMSDGTSTIFRRDPETFAEVGRFTVTDRGAPVVRLNELEYINGSLWANIWQTDEIVIIDPTNGEVTARVNLAGLLPQEMSAGADVLNGIAYDAENDRIFVTGKRWPLLFEIKLVLP